MSYRIGLTYNVKTEWVLRPGDPPDLNAEFDSEETVKHIELALEENGCEVVRIGSARHLLEQNGKVKKVDIVFNIAEGFGGRNRESQVPILLEMLGIPFVGADGLTLGLTLDKVLTKKVLIAEDIPTPKYFEVTDFNRLSMEKLRYPLFVKLRSEGSSKGLTEKSLVNNLEELQHQVKHLMNTYKEASIFVEEFIEGQEFTVAVIGNENPTVYPVVQIALDGVTDLGKKFFSWRYLRTGSDYVCPAPIPEKMAKKMQEIALRTYQVVECRDFGRVDFRTDKQGNPYVLEINPLPSLSDQDVFNFICKTQGMTHHGMIHHILETALERYGMKTKPKKAGALSATRSH